MLADPLTTDQPSWLLLAVLLSRLIILSGAEIGAPVIADGPSIMNERTQIKSAFARYQAGEWATWSRSHSGLRQIYGAFAVDRGNAKQAIVGMTEVSRNACIDREFELSGNLDAAQKLRLLEIAERCPVHRTLKSEISSQTSGL